MKYISKKINKSVFQINRTIFSSASIDPIIRVPLIDTSDIENKGKKFRFLPTLFLFRHYFIFTCQVYVHTRADSLVEGAREWRLLYDNERNEGMHFAFTR